MKYKNDKLVCDCCGKPATGVYSSSFGAVSFAYCEKCAKNDIEPYGVIISYVSCGCNTFDDMNGYYQNLVKKNLDFYGKTIEDFNTDLAKINNEYDEWVNSLENKGDDK